MNGSTVSGDVDDNNIPGDVAVAGERDRIGHFPADNRARVQVLVPRPSAAAVPMCPLSQYVTSSFRIWDLSDQISAKG